MSLCAYELQRLANIASNQAVLDQLGLGGDNSLKKPKKLPVRKSKPDSDDDDDKTAPVPRRTTRKSGKPDYVELSDEFMCMEERGLLKRAKREIKQAAPRYDEIQAAEIALREEKRALKVAHQAKLARDNMQRERSERAERMRIAAERRMAAPQPSLPLFQCASRSANVPPYPTKGKVEICPLCNGPFVRRKDGSMRKHDCVDATPWVPNFT